MITNNLLFDNGEGGILIGQGDGPNNGDVDADNMLVANNIVIDNRGSQGIRESGATGSNNRYLNNNVVGNAVDGIGLRTGTEIRHDHRAAGLRQLPARRLRRLPAADRTAPTSTPARPTAPRRWDIVGSPPPAGWRHRHRRLRAVISSSSDRRTGRSVRAYGS